MPSYVVTGEDRAWFAACGRAWDLGALGRRALEPLDDAGASSHGELARALRAALAVHYFPGMWAWERTIVEPLVHAAYAREGGPAEGRPLLERFQRWSPRVDRFTPVRVEADIDVPVPDPERPGSDLATAGGQRVRYRDRVALVLIDDDDERLWLGEHRVVEDFAHPDELALDERLLVACWAWEQLELQAPVAGVHYTELRLEGLELRRSVIPRTTTEKRGAAARLGAEVRAMLEPTASVAPRPEWSHCSRCAFRGPCLAMNRGEDSEPRLAAAYRSRPADRLEEGRLGGASWGLGRGAAPPHLGRRPEDPG